MGSSSYMMIQQELKWVYEGILPKTILDVGCGFGRWGFLGREVLEVWNLRYNKKDWKIKIDAVEIFKDFITPVHRYLYDEIIIGDIRKVAKDLKEYDLIIMSDIIEHLTKEDGLKIVDELLEKCKWMIIQTPLGFRKQPEVFGNKYEEHLSGYFPEDFKGKYIEIVEAKNMFAILLIGRLLKDLILLPDENIDKEKAILFA